MTGREQRPIGCHADRLRVAPELWREYTLALHLPSQYGQPYRTVFRGRVTKTRGERYGYCAPVDLVWERTVDAEALKIRR